ncbi:PKD domain-containing protein [Cellulomonas cellasea]|nr:PKD domain-containing protein [Cellulomonas cellasea]
MAAVAILVSTPALAGFESDAEAEKDTVFVRARLAHETEQGWLAAKASSTPAARLVEYARAELCDVSSQFLTSTLDGACDPADGAITPPDCGLGIAPALPLWARYRIAENEPWTRWDRISDYYCPQDVLPEFTAEDFRRLPLTPSPVTPQPSNPNLLTGLGLVVHTTADPQDHPTTLLDFPITVRATPTGYTWDFGDGTRTTTTHPGAPYPAGHDHLPGDPVYPHGVIGHPYPSLGTYTPTLTTTWTGQYLIAGTTDWRPIDGTATTTTALPTVTIHDATSHLVADNCHQNPHGPGC